MSLSAKAVDRIFARLAATYGAAWDRSLGALPWDAVVKGLMIGSTIMVGSVLARRFVLKLDAQRFRLMIEGLLLVAGGTMLWAAWRHG